MPGRRFKYVPSAEKTAESILTKDQQQNSFLSLKLLFCQKLILIVALLQHNGITAHLFNRNNASILIHPMGEMKAKVMVAQTDGNRALRIIENANPHPDSPEDSSTA